MAQEIEVDEINEVQSGSLTAKEAAAHFGMEEKAFRAQLRRMTAVHPGRGNKWVIPAEMLDEIGRRLNRSNRKETVVVFKSDD